MSIRPAIPADSAALARIQVDSYRAAYAGILPADYLAAFSYEDQTQDWRDLLSAGTPAEIVALHVRRDRQGQG